MPQVYIKLSPHAVKTLGEDLTAFLAEIDEQVTDCIVLHWGVPRDDIACSAEALLYVRNEAHIQIEVRYTVGPDIYEEGVYFDPTEEMQSTMIDAAMPLIRPAVERYRLTDSMWCKPHEESVFRISS